MTPLDVSDVKIAAAAAAASMSCALPGLWLMLRRHSLMGDALSHTALPGVVIAFLLVHAIEQRQPPGSSVSAAVLHAALVVGAAVIGVLTSVITEFVQKLGRVDSGAALGVVFTWFFALGLFLLRLLADTVHIDPDCVLFGLLETAAWDDGVPRSVWLNGGALAVNLLLLALCYKEMQLAAFDPALATTLGINARVMHYALMVSTAITVVFAFESVGSLIVVGLLITPAATAFLLTRRLGTMILLTLAIAAACGVLGHLAARMLPPVVFPALGLPEVVDVLSAGMVPVVAGVLFVLAWLFSPQQGLAGTAIAQSRLAIRIAGDDLLSLLFRMEERGLGDETHQAPRLVGDRLGLGRLLTRLTVLRLRRKRLITGPGSEYELTDRGRHQARSLVRGHRLWETYLQKHFALPPDHLHEPAHRVEHYLDDRLREDLSSELDAPRQDPHGREIPREDAAS